jgi:hypothetical protein
MLSSDTRKVSRVKKRPGQRGATSATIWATEMAMQVNMAAMAMGLTASSRVI